MKETARQEMAPFPPLEKGQVENPLFNLFFVPPLDQQPVVPKTSVKEWVAQSLCLKRRRVENCALQWTIRLGYGIQFARRPPKFRGIRFTSLKAVDTVLFSHWICFVCRNRSPVGAGQDSAGPSRRYEVGVLQALLHCSQEK